MSVSVRVPTILRTYTGGAAEVSTEPGTLREVIAKLDAAYPGLGGRILDDAGKLRRFINVYVAEEDVRFAQGLDTPVADGQQVSVIPAVAGGCGAGVLSLSSRSGPPLHKVRSCPVAVGTTGSQAPPGI